MKKGVAGKVPMTPKTGIPKVSSLRPLSKPIKIDLKEKKNVNPPFTPREILEIQNSEASSSAPTNPFQIDLVLDTLFNYVKKRDLPACRLASKNWNTKLIPRFRDEFEIYVCAVNHTTCKPFPNQNLMKEFSDGCKPKKDRSLETFVKLIRTSLHIPYTKFRLDLNTRGNYRNQFFKVCGPIMTHITLQNWTLEPDNFFDKPPSDECFLIENLREMFKFSSNLKSLCFNTRMFRHKNPTIQLFDDNGLTQNLPSLKILAFRDYRWPEGKAPSFIDELLAQTPNLIDISFTDTTWDYNDVFSALLTPDRPFYIENLTTDSYRIHSGFLNRMEQFGVKLKRLFITGSDLDVPVYLYRLIELQKDNLLEFTYKLSGRDRGLFNAPSLFPLGPEFPRMSSLKILRFHNEGSRLFQILCSEMTFCKKFPSLETFSCYNGYGVLDLNFLGVQSCPKLNSMELHFYELHEGGFTTMAEMYSLTLTSLKLNSGRFTNPNILKLIWSHLINLKELELQFSVKNFSGNFDSIFTGVSIENCMKIKNDPAHWNFMLTKGKALEKRKKLRELTLVRDSSIADLKSLKRVSLKFPGVGLTDITGYLGFYLLENLRHIHIDFCEFTNTCCEGLKKELHLESWVFRAKNGRYVYDMERDPGPFGFGFRGKLVVTKEIVPPCSYPYKERKYLLGL